MSANVVKWFYAVKGAYALEAPRAQAKKRQRPQGRARGEGHTSAHPCRPERLGTPQSPAPRGAGKRARAAFPTGAPTESIGRASAIKNAFVAGAGRAARSPSEHASDCVEKRCDRARV